jgi:hypothetical protein
VRGTPAAVEHAEEALGVAEREDRQRGVREVVRDPALRRAPPSQASTASFSFLAAAASNFPLTLMMLAWGHFCTQMPQLVHFA